MPIDKTMDKEDVVHYIHNRILLSYKKNNEIVSFAATWMDLEIVILSEVSQKEKEKYCITFLICGIDMIHMNLFMKEKKAHILREQINISERG